MNVLLRGDCVDVLPALRASSVDAIVTDPPYGLEFMGHDWDKLGATAEHPDDGEGPWGRIARVRFGDSAKSAQEWHYRWAVEALRVAKPGAHLVAFGGTRTYHRLACALEDAGWEIRDSLNWLYGQGFPKSFDVSKGVDALDAPDATHRDALTFTAWLRGTGVTREAIRDATGTFMDSHYLSVGSQPAVPTGEQWAKIRPLIRVPIPEWVDAMIGEAGRASENLARRPVVAIEEGSLSKEGDLYAPGSGRYVRGEFVRTAAFTAAAARWAGWGTALKPGWEPIILARKPLAASTARNLLAHGTGALNIDACRLPVDPEDPVNDATFYSKPNLVYGEYADKKDGFTRAMAPPPGGRWPPNVLLDEEAARLLDAETGERGTSAPQGERGRRPGGFYDIGSEGGNGKPAGVCYGDFGGVSRFFYCAKASRAEREMGLAAEDGEARYVTSLNNTHPVCNVCGCGTVVPGPGQTLACGHTDKRYEPAAQSVVRNHHPTVKPVSLMRWLVRLVTPPGGLVVDPFTGSGTTGIACELEGFRFVGIEREPEYLRIARARIRLAATQPAAFVVQDGNGAEKPKDERQLTLL